MRVVWATDVHLDFLEEDALAAFVGRIRAAAPEIFLLAGDISNGVKLTRHLERLEREVACRIAFVLGNHDYYRSSVARVRGDVRALVARSERLTWLSGENEPIALDERTGLVGHDGWADARLGDYAGSPVVLNDFHFIEDLVGLGWKGRPARLQALADEAAAHLAVVLARALERFERTIVVTHLPPFREACWHEGRISSDHYLPFFTCKAVGDVLLEAAEARPDRRIEVLCGHTHGAGVARLRPNLVVRTGGAEYGEPELQPPLDE